MNATHSQRIAYDLNRALDHEDADEFDPGLDDCDSLELCEEHGHADCRACERCDHGLFLEMCGNCYDDRREAEDVDYFLDLCKEW